MSKLTQNITSKRLMLLLTPSAISAVFSVIVGLSLVLGVVFINRYQSSSLRLEYLYYQSHHSALGGTLTGSLLQNNLINDLPLIFFWALVGIVVYLVASDLVRGFSSAVELREEMDYVHVHRRELVRTVTAQLLLRLVVILVWIPYILFFFHRIVPYCVTLTIAATSTGSVWQLPAYIVLSVVVASLALHVNLILLRLLLLKPRLIGSAEEIS